ncbi:hypothetical protein EUGRSUZ_H04205 [Eucalyptus grandis]|uniref:Uncharacterized protein n=2 Tax=Eucalyptus grandis TaxID=71139 RepID=A0ACC3JW53_EUCGR|nr:hypothetical protein EUGRSUZ_H04205 [Eucalyptus grandis]
MGTFLCPPAEAARAFFVFGNSLVDNGNNNYLATTARADLLPYGIDYPTGRPNGRSAIGFGVDVAVPTGQKLLVGASFASAGIGILNDTGTQFMNILRMHTQFECFEEYQKRVNTLVGSERTQQLVNQALVLITVGGNDFVNNYFLVPYSARSHQFAIPNYVKFLISEYWKLLGLGARRVLVMGTGPMGCAPAELALRGKEGQCAPELQEAALLFNPQLTQMLQGLNQEYGSPVFIAANTDLMHRDFISNPQAYEFVTSEVACCGQGPYNGIGLCTIASNLCLDRDQYAFWDPFHPSQKANRLIVQSIMKGSAEYMYPPQHHIGP